MYYLNLTSLSFMMCTSFIDAADSSSIKIEDTTESCAEDSTESSFSEQPGGNFDPLCTLIDDDDSLLPG
jgi:hypothetical protein